MTGGAITTLGVGSTGMSVGGVDATAFLTDVDVSTDGYGSLGLLVGAGSAFTMYGGSVSTSGDVSQGVLAERANASINGASITTVGDTSTGVALLGGPGKPAQITISDSQVTTHGANSHGLGVMVAHDGGAVKNNGHVDANRVSITTDGTNSAGVIAGLFQIYPTSPAAIQNPEGRAAGESEQSLISLTDSTVTTNGDGSAGVVVKEGSRITGNNTTITTRGAASAGVSILDDGVNDTLTDSSVLLTNSTVIAQGAGSVGALLEGGTLSVDGGALSSAQDSAIHVDAIDVALAPTPVTFNLGNSAQVSGGNGVFVRASNENPLIGLNMDQVQAKGDIFGDDTDGNGLLTASTTMTMDNQSTWQGATNGTIAQLALNGGSQWTVTGNSTVGQMILNNSALAFAEPTTGDYKTLTVTGDFSSDGGQLFMNTELNDDNSGTDKLHVLGNTSGQASVHVNNVGGTGADTIEGINLIQVDGQSNAGFTLAGRAVGGSHEYFLHQGSVSNPTDGGWYLRSELVSTRPVNPIFPTPTVDPAAPVDPVDPAPPVDPVDPAPPVGPTGPDRSTPVYRPEVGSYLSNQAAAVNMFQMTMHDRLGNPELDAQRVDDKRLGSLWMRATRNEADFSAGSGQLDVDSETTTLQLGADLMHWGEKGRGLLGVMAGTGTNKNTTRSDLTGYSSKGEVKGTSVGVYGTCFADPVGATGLYVDSWVQYGRYDNSVHGEGLGKENYDSTALTGSLEAGYGWKVFNNESTRIDVQPQLQITGTKYESDDIREANGSTIKSKDAGDFATRTGIRVFGQVDLNSGMKVQPFATVNFHQNSQSNAIAFNDSVMEGADPKNRYEFKTGAQLAIGKNWSTWGEVNVQSGDDDYSDVSAQVGLKYNF